MPQLAGGAPIALQCMIAVWLAGGATILGLLCIHGWFVRPNRTPVAMRVVDLDEAPRLRVLAGGVPVDRAVTRSSAPRLRVLRGGGTDELTAIRRAADN
ncbi:MAG: hypothetical protein ACT4OX_07070 [Actinomycetota bacterium]